jgi:hypothetical protein
MISREPIYAALFALYSGLPCLATASRRLKHWSDVPAINQPAAFQAQVGEIEERKHGFPPKWLLMVNIYVYVNAGKDPSAIPATALNTVLDAMGAAIEPDGLPQGVQTLGGLVNRCWISGKIETDEGALGEQAVAIVPVEILVTA